MATMSDTQPKPYRFAFRDFIQLARPYWVSDDKKKGWALLLVILTMNLALVWVNVRLNFWNAAFYNSLQAKNFPDFKHLLFVFSGYALLYIVLAVYSQYFLQMLQIRWRRWVTEVFLKDWLVGGAHYRMSLRQGNSDNPDQRIADDIRSFVNDSLSLFFGFISSLVTLLSFLTILWTLSGAFTLLGHSIPGYMVWVAIAYAGIGSYFAHKVGKPLIKLNFNQQRYEADFRFGLARTREHNEGIALYRGEDREMEGHNSRFANVWSNWWGIMKRQKLFTWYSSFYGQLAIIFPILVAAPRYFAGQIQLGGLTQTASAFGQVQGALSWFIDAYGRIVDWRATVERLYTFVQSVEAVRHVPIADLMDGQLPAAPAPGVLLPQGPGRGGSSGGAALAIELGDLRVATPDGRALLQADGQCIQPMQHTLFVGPSGLGKSTLVRWLAGIWPYAEGTHYRLPVGRSLFLPQKPYLPIGTLRQALTYPMPAEPFDDARLQVVLTQARVPYLFASIDQTDTWMQRLSPGEQQRLAIARALLAAPDWLFLDEATSALDPPTEAAMYELLQRELPQTTLVSVAHRPGVVRFHRQILLVKTGGEGEPAHLLPHTPQHAETLAASEPGDWALAGA